MSKAIAPRTNGDRVQPLIDEAKTRLAEAIVWAREHPDEAAVAGLPVVLAFSLSAKYRMSLIDHMLITEAGWQLGVALLGAYREWKTRPARPSLKEVA